LLGTSSIVITTTSPYYTPPFNFENLEDEWFNIRDKHRGPNFEFMSYANLVQAKMDPLALLDPEVLLKHTQRTFQTFFQHYASQAKWTDGSMMAYERISEDEAEKVEVVVTERIETLSMVPLATWLYFCIIFILVLILITILITLKLEYPANILEHDVDCLADVIALIEGSPELSGYTERWGIDELKRSGLKTRLGWFRYRGGVVRLGIEIEDAEGIEWVERPEGLVVSELAKKVIRVLDQDINEETVSANA
jgi:hypothetical protein